MIELLPGEGVRGHDVQRIALHRADEGQGHAGAAAGVLDDRAVRGETAVRLGRLDHGERHPVLHAAGGVLALELQQDAGAVRGHDVAQGQQRGVADAVQDAALLVGQHGRPLSRRARIRNGTEPAISNRVPPRRVYAGSLAPSTSTRSMTGGAASRVEACAMSALAIGPVRWLCRPASS